MPRSVIQPTHSDFTPGGGAVRYRCQPPNSASASTAYLGQIRLFKMDKTTAVGSVIPDKLKGTIQENDHVATRIK